MFTNIFFTNNKNLFSQISYVIILANATKKANIVYWSLIKCKRVTKNVLAFKLYRIAYSFNIAIAIKSIVDKVLQINLPLVLYTDSKLLYNCFI